MQWNKMEEVIWFVKVTNNIKIKLLLNRKQLDDYNFELSEICKNWINVCCLNGFWQTFISKNDPQK